MRLPRTSAIMLLSESPKSSESPELPESPEVPELPGPSPNNSGDAGNFGDYGKATSRTEVSPRSKRGMRLLDGGSFGDDAGRAVHVANRHGQGIRRVVRRRNGVEPEQQLDHLLHLHFLGASETDDRAFDFGRRVFHARHARFARREQGDAAGMAQLQRAAYVARVKQI